MKTNESNNSGSTDAEPVSGRVQRLVRWFLPWRKSTWSILIKYDTGKPTRLVVHLEAGDRIHDYVPKVMQKVGSRYVMFVEVQQI